jgi:hypothetical protein
MRPNELRGRSSFGHIGRVTIVTCVALLSTAVSQAPGAVRESSAHTARLVNGTDTAHLHLIHQEETVLSEEGPATGALPGHMRAELNIGSIYTGRCTIYAADGSITGRGTATPHGSGRYQSFHGTLLITGGTGRYAHVHGRTELYGTFDRRTYAVVIQTTGNLSY